MLLIAMAQALTVIVGHNTLGSSSERIKQRVSTKFGAVYVDVMQLYKVVWMKKRITPEMWTRYFCLPDADATFKVLYSI